MNRKVFAIVSDSFKFDVKHPEKKSSTPTIFSTVICYVVYVAPLPPMRSVQFSPKFASFIQTSIRFFFVLFSVSFFFRLSDGLYRTLHSSVSRSLNSSFASRLFSSNSLFGLYYSNRFMKFLFRGSTFSLVGLGDERVPGREDECLEWGGE